MKTRMHKTAWLMTIVSTVILAASCKTVVRENVISSIDTGFGACITANKQNQVPEIKVGYIRSQFYSVPTGKVVENNGDKNLIEVDHQTNAADLTPQMVAGIRVESGWGNGPFTANISENFAIGKEAVNSDAATAMYITSAKNPAVAAAASQAVRFLRPEVMIVSVMTNSISAYKQYKALPTPEDKAKWDAVISAVTTRTNMADLISNETPQDWDVVIRALKNRDLMK